MFTSMNIIQDFKVRLQWTRQFRVSKEIYEACLFEKKVLRNKTA